CISIDFTSPTLSAGWNATFMPGFRTPVSMRPTATTPIPVMLYTSWIGIRSGLSTGFDGTSRLFSAATMVGPLYQDIFVDGFTMFSPLYELIGMNGTLSTLYPTDFRSWVTSVLISLNRASEYSGFVASILLIATISCSTPRVLARKMCSFVCVWTPSAAPTTRTAASAWDVPVIMFL